MDTTLPTPPIALATLTAAAVIMCYACNTPFDDGDEELKCMVKGCGNAFHPGCATTVKLTTNEKADWVCPECKCSIRKQGDYIHTPVGASKIRAANVTIRKRPNREEINTKPASVNLEFPSTEFLEIMSEVHAIRQDMSLMKDMLRQVTATLARYDSKMETLTAQLSKLHSHTPQQPQHTYVNPSEHRRISYAAAAATNSPAKSLSGTSVEAITDATNQSQPNTVPVLRELANTQAGASHSPLKHKNKETVTQAPQKPQRPASIRCTGAGGTTGVVLKAVERRQFLHLWNMVSSLDDVRMYLKELCPTGTCTVEELKSKGDYKSYKIGVPDIHYEKCFAPDVWPDNARLKAWIPFRGPTNNTSEQQRA